MNTLKQTLKQTLIEDARCDMRQARERLAESLVVSRTSLEEAISQLHATENKFKKLADNLLSLGLEDAEIIVDAFQALSNAAQAIKKQLVKLQEERGQQV